LFSSFTSTILTSCMVYNDGMLVAADHISTITHSPLQRETPGEILFKTPAKEKRSKVLVINKQAAKVIHPNLVAISASLKTLAKNLIVKKSIVNPRLSFHDVMKVFKKFVCIDEKIIHEDWYDQFYDKVSQNLNRFYYSRMVERLAFFFESLRTKGESLTFGAMGGISIFHAEQPHFGRIASIGNPDQRKV
jgi:hypothetical protein